MKNILFDIYWWLLEVKLWILKPLFRLRYKGPKGKDISNIPKGVYCYDGLNYKDDIIHIKPCQYFKSYNRYLAGCTYLGILTDDMVFTDQCKICNINKNF